MPVASLLLLLEGQLSVLEEFAFVARVASHEGFGCRYTGRLHSYDYSGEGKVLRCETMGFRRD